MYKYPVKDYNKEHMAKGVGIGLPISRKDSIEICNFIRGKKIAKVKEELKDVIDIKKAVPIKRFNKDRGHKKKIGPGKYPKKAAQEILRLLENVEANAQFKGLNTADLIVYHISANQGATQWHYGRQRRRKMKRTNLVIVVKEKKGEKVSKEDKKSKAPKTAQISNSKKSEVSNKVKKDEKWLKENLLQKR